MPTPASLSYLWNLGSLLGTCLLLQIMTGVFLGMYYVCDTSLAFNSVDHIMRDVNNGWLIRISHANGASFFFVCVYLHVGRSLYYGGHANTGMWLSGLLLMVIMMATAFLGYVLPWGQMSFWGATVITNFFSAIPLVGGNLVLWLWGGFSVGQATLSRFFSLHYLLPFMLVAVVGLHISVLHVSGSINSSSSEKNLEKQPFFPYFTSKDLHGFMVLFFFLAGIVFFRPYLLGDAENFIKANPLVTPVHIVPEWYFLFAYAILRAVPFKLGGLLALIMSLAILVVVPLLDKSGVRGISYRPFSKIAFTVFISNIILLTWLGAKPVSEPFITLSRVSGAAYFLCLTLIPLGLSLIELRIVAHR